MAASKTVEVRIEDKTLKLSNLDKVLYPAAGFTKAQMIDYYTRIAPALIPHLSGRPLTLKRYPNGVDEEFFFEKNCPKHRPDWVHTAEVWSWGNNRNMYYCVADDLPTLVWVANLASIELHTSLSLGKKIEQPTCLVFDLDPGPPADIVDCCEVGIWVRDLFASVGMKSFAKTSGSKGLQLYVPLNTAVDYTATKEVSKGIAMHFEREHPDRVVHQQLKELRRGKILIDWSQNDQYKTTVNVYSLRAREHPTVSTPVTWDEVSECLERRDASLLRFMSDQVLERVDAIGDLFEPVLKLKQKLASGLPTTDAPKKRVMRAPASEEAREKMRERMRSRVSQRGRRETREPS
ncbi:MAG TPA: non-homologous end-joining DNA ligase [Candidatus Dormibacteraeota bacterium]